MYGVQLAIPVVEVERSGAGQIVYKQALGARWYNESINSDSVLLDYLVDQYVPWSPLTVCLRLEVFAS